MLGLELQDLPTALRDVVEIADKKVAKAMACALKAFAKAVVNEAVTSAADSWDLMFGHLMAYKESMKDFASALQECQYGYGLKEPVSLHVPVTATVHGEPVGICGRPLVWFHVLAICGASRRPMGGSTVSGVAPAS
ncbi:UCHL3 [Symbiodinium sp. CCMP2592]|nr:UCHL3 [Symbiodinium sp. CCMP2592]